MVIVLLGIISAVAMPKFFGRSSFDERVLFDDTLAALRYAQKQAVASGCKTRMVFTNTTFDLLSDDNCNSGNFNSSLTVPHPATGENSYSGSQNNVTITANNATTTFNAIGTADADNLIKIGKYSINVVAATGFSYDSTP